MRYGRPQIPGRFKVGEINCVSSSTSRNVLVPTQHRIQTDPLICGFSICGFIYPRFTTAPQKFGKLKKWTIHKFKTRARRERAVTCWNPAAQTRPVLDSSSFVPVPTPPLRTCQHSASSVLAVRIICCVIAIFLFRKQREEWRSRWIPTTS